MQELSNRNSGSLEFIIKDKFGQSISKHDLKNKPNMTIRTPLIIACTSEIITNELLEKLRKIGFDLAFQSPLTAV